MINTIFYFTDTEQEYLDTYAYGQVKPHTICFARDTKSIWRDGLRFSGLRKDEVDSIINEDVKPLIDTLEAALNLANQQAIDRDNQLTEDLHDLENTIAVVDGRITTEKNRLDAEISRIDGDIADTNQRLLAEHQALIDTADDIQGKLDRGEVAYNSGWNENVKAYMQTVGMWDYGEDSSIVTKWSTLRQSVDNVSSEVNQVRQTENGHYTTLNSKIDQTASNITSEVNRVEAKADGYNNTLQSKINQEVTDRGEAVTTLSNTFAKSTKDLQGVIEWMYSGLHSGASADMSYAEIIAAGKNGASSAISDLRTSIETTSDGKYVAQNSLTSSVDNAISGIVNAAAGTYANTQLFAKIDQNGSNIASLTADVTELDQAIQGIATNEHLTATFLAKTDFDTAKAALEAADTQNANAIGQVQTQVTRLDGGPEVTNSVAAKVNSAISTFEQKVNDGKACTMLVNKVDATSENLAALIQYIDPDEAYTTIGVKIAASEAGVVTKVKDDLATAGILTKNDSGYTSAVYTQTETKDAINSATAGLMAANDFTSASVVAKVNDAGSGIAINADKIKIDANHQLDLSAQTITIDADDINLVGQTNFENAIGNWITAKGLNIADVNGQIQSVISGGNATFNGDVVANTLTAGNPNEMHITTSNGEIQFVNANGVAVARFVINGNGMDLILLDSNGNPYTIDWSHWQSQVSYNTMNFYTFTATSKNSFIRYYNSSEENNTVTNRTYYDSPNTANLGQLSNYQDVYILLRTEYKNSLISGSNVLCHTFSGSNDYTGSYSTDGRSPVKITQAVGVYEKVTMSNGVLTTTGQYLYFADDWVLKVAYDYAPQQFQPQRDQDYTMSRYDTAPRKVVQQSDYTGVYFGAESRTDSYNGASYNEYVRKEGTVTDLYAPV